MLSSLHAQVIVCLPSDNEGIKSWKGYKIFLILFIQKCTFPASQKLLKFSVLEYDL